MEDSTAVHAPASGGGMNQPHDPVLACDRCLGRRLVGAAGADVQRSKAVAHRAAQVPAPGEIPETDCTVCEGAFASCDTWLRLALDALRDYEFATFQVGTVFPAACEEAERAFSKAMGQEKVGESIRTEANRALALAIAQATGGITVPEGRPDVAVVVDTRFWTASAESQSVFVRGRYTKHRRDIPQTHWPCRRCEGRGCWECKGSGVTYAESVEDAVGTPFLRPFGAASFSFHGAGREDIDALMLGTGRPFILELHGPHKRLPTAAELADLAQAINAATSATGVGVQGLRMAQKEEVAQLKEAGWDKEYLAHCLSEAPVPKLAVLDAAAALTGVTLEQRTPERVSHRRADLVRKRKLHAVTLEAMAEDPGTRFTLRVLAESGTYIKEMVNSDEGRTTPSFSSALGIPVKVEFLDVVGILD